jgi:hypothetical protein
MMIRATISLVVLASLVALTENCCCEQKGVVDDEKAWTDLVEVFSANESKSMAGTQVSDHLAAIKAVSLGTHFHHELAPKLIEIFIAQIDAIRFVKNFAFGPGGASITDGRIRWVRDANTDLRPYYSNRDPRY